MKSSRRIILGICAMDKKARSKPMQEILSRLSEQVYDILIFGNECILYEPVENWPIVDYLISFYSDGFPLHKAIEYWELRKPFLINDLKMQYNLQDRRKVYQMLEDNNIAVPRHVFVERDIPGIEHIIEEYDEYIVLNGVQLNKPLVEKPVNADDHNIYIYYPMSVGGGSKRLFRKVADRSSEFFPKDNDIRRDGSYIYEEFINTQGIDVKVYTVGPNYGHAQARKSPVVDGKVMRDESGKEMHLPVILTPQEKEFSKRITHAFKQTVCGFDLLRVPGKSYVCDVNGWSFVKSSRKYYDDCAKVLHEMMLTTLRSQHSLFPSHIPRRRLRSTDRSFSSPVPESCDSSPNSRFRLQRSPILPLNDPEVSDNLEDIDEETSEEELLCVISVIRHGDRTPKQKIKLKLNTSRFLDFYHSYSKSPTDNIKLKSKSALLEFLEIVKYQISQTNSQNLQGKELEFYLKLCCIKDILEDREIHGLTRKIQLKPEKWIDWIAPTSTEENFFCESPTIIRATEVLCIVKWGGDLTPLGEKQAELVGENFRKTMYPDPSGGGILRLHSTFRHDLKIKSSDEGRVMKTAAAFTKGLLELEGDLTPVLVSLVTVQEKNSQMLDHYENNEVKSDLDYCKVYLNRVLQLDMIMTIDVIENLLPGCDNILKENLIKLGNPREKLRMMHLCIKEVCDQIKQLSDNFTLSPLPPPSSAAATTSSTPPTTATTSTSTSDSNSSSSQTPLVPYLNETFLLMLDRWKKLDDGFFKYNEDQYDLSKVPELHDMVRYDVLHNYHLPISCLTELFGISKLFADCVVPQEYGITNKEKRLIGRKMCHALLHKIQYDLMVAQSGSNVDMHCMLDETHTSSDFNLQSIHRCIRTRLYFTSESHLYTLFHVLSYPSQEPTPTPTASTATSTHTTTPTSATPPTPFFDSDHVRLHHNACELSYLSQITIRLFENKFKSLDSPERYRCEILLSSGAISDPCLDKTAEVSPHIVLNNQINCQDLINYFQDAIAGYETTFLPRARSDGDNEMMFC